MKPRIWVAVKTGSGTLFCFLLFLTFSSSNSALVIAQEPAKPAATPAPKSEKKTSDTSTAALPTGTIKGRVVSEDGRPIANASVAPGSSLQTQKMMHVDAEGRFSLDDLPAASYAMMVLAPGYVDQSLLEADPNQRPRHLIGSQVKLVMIKGGVITGAITDSKGQPVVGVPVSATSINNSSTLNSYMLGILSGAESDDRGVYRIFGLPPGQYTVTAGGGGPFGQFSASGFDLEVPTYYPSATRDTALPVTVRAGEETIGIDIRYRGLEGHSISGNVTGVIEGSAAMGAVTVMLSHASTSSALSLGVVSAADQRRVFEFNAVGDGEYDVLAMLQSGPNEDPLVGTKRVIVRGADVTGVEVKLSRLASINGAMVIDPIKAEDKCDKRNSQISETVLLTPRDEPKKSGSQVLTELFAAHGETLNAKGEFAMRNLEAGRYRLAITLPTEAWYVRTITPSAAASTAPQAAKPRPADAWQGVIPLKAGERVGPLSILIGQDAAGLRGRVELTAEASTIPAGLRVHLVPADREEANNILRYSEAVVASDGSFAFTNLAPGRYLIATLREPVTETGSTTPRPAALDPSTRNKVRQEAETANTIVELKPCQQLVDYKVGLKTNQ